MLSHISIDQLLLIAVAIIVVTSFQVVLLITESINYQSNIEACGWDDGNCEDINKALQVQYPDCDQVQYTPLIGPIPIPIPIQCIGGSRTPFKESNFEMKMDKGRCGIAEGTDCEAVEWIEFHVEYLYFTNFGKCCDGQGEDFEVV